MPDIDAVADLDLPATLAVLAHEAETLPPRAAMAHREVSELVVWLAVRAHGPLECTALYPDVCSSGSVTKSINALVRDGLCDRHRRPYPTASDLVWDPSIQTLDTTKSQQAAISGEPIPDGGQVVACPECDTTGKVHHRIGSVQGPDAQSDCTYYCGSCGADFEQPVERPSNDAGGSLRGGARALDEADPDEILPDGGRPIEPASVDASHPTARASDEPLSRYSFKIPGALIAQLDTLVDVGLYATRSEALRSAIRREVRLQAGERDTVAETLQRTYTVAMAGRRPETIGSLERLAEQLGVDLEREVMDP